MSAPKSPGLTSRRTFLQTTGVVAAASAFTGLTVQNVHAQGDSTVQVALVGCGGRGTGAVADALNTKSGPIKLVAMADVFRNNLNNSYNQLSRQLGGLVDVPEARGFVGFEAYKQAIDCLKPHDVVILTTPPAFRWVHYKYAIEKGVNVFMEKPVTVDGPSSKKMLALYEEALKKNIKTGVGLMCRHSASRGELFDRVKNGEAGDIISLRSYRMHGPVASFQSPRKPDGMTEVEYQIRRFHSFLWASGGCFNDFYIHNIDECCWIKDAWPIEAQASGGRHYRGDNVDQNFDNYSVEYTFADGAKMFHYGRCIAGADEQFASYAHGSKGLAVISEAGHWPAKARIYKGQKMDRANIAWQYPGEETNPYQREWDHLIDAIRNDKPYNEVKRGVEASLVSSMGRMAAHTGRKVTYEEMLNCEHEFAPNVDKLTKDSEAPVKADANGKYPVPMPGVEKDREYATI